MTSVALLADEPSSEDVARDVSDKPRAKQDAAKQVSLQ
jgi:hypothetical protein